ncbi:MAG TPA: hypothetical protein VFC93_14490 [Chloroflexota bacterium]|nr:hypothetical protein [Chloroflexota bacterium]
MLCVALALSPGARMAVLTAFLLPDLFNAPGPRPLVLVSGAPTRVELRIGSADADLYMPAGGGRHGGLVVTAGVHPLDKRDPVLVRLADGLSRVGLYVLLVQSDALMADRFEPEEPRNLVLAYQRLAAEPGVDARHIGMLGFSAGASLAFLAATDPAIRDEVRELVWLGGYYDANELADEIEAHRYGDTAWEPHPLTQMVFEKNLSNGRAALAALSPKSRVGDFRSRAWVLVDRADPLVPYVHSRELAAALPPAHLAGYVEFQIFEHVQPTKALPPATFVTELWKLTTTVWRVLVPLDPSN